MKVEPTTLVASSVGKWPKVTWAGTLWDDLLASFFRQKKSLKSELLVIRPADAMVRRNTFQDLCCLKILAFSSCSTHDSNVSKSMSFCFILCVLWYF